jgi:NDP-sugar pyrophosphorylase family protein
MQIVIPLSGIGKRFKEAGYTVPKPLIDVDGRPMIQHVIQLFPGETNIIFICNDLHLHETNMRDILMEICPTCQIIEVSVENRRGPVDAVLQASHVIQDESEVIVSYCDYGTVWDYPRFLKDVRNNQADGAIPAYIGFHPHMLGKDHYAYMTHQDKWMTAIQEKKPFTDNKMNEYASNGTYYFKKGSLMKNYFRQLISEGIQINGEYYVSMVYNLLVKDGLKVRIFEIEKMLQWGTPYDLEIYQMWSAYFKEPSMVSIPDTENRVTILPMAGRGSRFTMEGFTVAKPFLEINGLPMVVQAIRDLPPTQDLTIITLQEHLEHYPKEFETLKSYFPHLTIKAIDEVTDGQATTCSMVLDTVANNRPILISACDNGVYYNSSKYNQLVQDENIDVIVWSFTNHPTSKLYPHMYAWLDVDENDWIKYVSVKKPLVDKENKHAIIGTMFFKRADIFKKGYDYICQHQIKTNGEYYVDDLLNPLIKMGYRVKVFPVDYYLCWGTPNDYKTYLYWESHFRTKS